MPSAAERLHEAERSAAHLQQQLRDVEHSIAALSAEAANQVEGASGPDLGHQPPLPASLADCAAELALLSAGELYLKRLQVGFLERIESSCRASRLHCRGPLMLLGKLDLR